MGTGGIHRARNQDGRRTTARGYRLGWLRRFVVVGLGVALIGASAIPAQAATRPETVLAVQPMSTMPGSPSVRGAAASALGATSTARILRTTANLSLRTGPGTSHRRLAILKENTVVVPTGKKSGKWWQVKSAGKTGWASSQYFKTTVTSTAPQVSYRYITKYVELRVASSPRASALLGLQRRTRVQYLGGSGAWRKVKSGSTTGYVPAASVSEKNPAPSYRWAKSSIAGYATIREGAKKTFALSKNTKVEWFRSTSGWDYVKSSAGAGWVRSENLGTKATATPQPKAYRWATATVNVRTGIGTGNRSLGTVAAWSRVEYLTTRSGWSQVRTSRGTGWIKNTYLSAHDRYDVAVYGTLRHGQSAYFLLKGKTTSETRTSVVDHGLYLRRDKTWWSYMVPGSGKDRVVVERMKFKPALHSATLKDMDSWERFDPSKPLDDQNYNRKLVTDASGAKVWAYVASRKMATYMRKSGIPVVSGDYLKRY